jgi:flavin-dependent dehydrogenase
MSASWLRLAGHDVTVLEKEQFPRPMVGESLIPHFWRFMEEIGMVEKMQEEGFIVKNGGIVNWEGNMRSVRLKDFGFKLPALHIERDVFDKMLLDRSKELGAHVFEECRVKSANFGDKTTVSFVDLTTGEEGQISCDYLIDGSGQTALISRQEGLRVMDEDFKFQSFWGYYRRSSYYDVEGVIHDFESRYTNPPATFIDGLDNWGWSWHILQRETVSIGYILPRNMMAKFK